MAHVHGDGTADEAAAAPRSKQLRRLLPSTQLETPVVGAAREPSPLPLFLLPAPRCSIPSISAIWSSFRKLRRS